MRDCVNVKDVWGQLVPNMDKCLDPKRVVQRSLYMAKCYNDPDKSVACSYCFPYQAETRLKPPRGVVKLNIDNALSKTRVMASRGRVFL
ncbi:hypothetical protein PVK06_006822 [Gossypium arboreum]|uniref:Uncharacterized protein n=1 Tax=Gossypium arboreum TaxID=29729 RepID=A0ABR0QFL7_GOSAR|nr:hypothetical protein PVK06_006822 [Gossypium arboreum]